MKNYYHGSNEKSLKINNDGLFEGIFASCDIEVAQSFGSIIYEIEIDECDILTQYEIIYECDYDAQIEFLEENTGAITEDQLEIAYACVFEEKCYKYSNLSGIFFHDCDAENGWFAQCLRGRYARENGFKAVECDDENGTVVLIVDKNLELKNV